MLSLMYKVNQAKLIFTKHCRDRLVQRYKLFLTLEEFNNPNIFLRNDFSTAKFDFGRYAFSPFYVNSSNPISGEQHIKAVSKNMVYACIYREHNNTLTVTTVYPKKRSMYDMNGKDFK